MRSYLHSCAIHMHVTLCTWVCCRASKMLYEYHDDYNNDGGWIISLQILQGCGEIQINNCYSFYGQVSKAQFTVWQGACVANLWNTKILQLFASFHDQSQSAMQRNARIGPESILTFFCVATSINAQAAQRNNGPCIVLQARPEDVGISHWTYIF